MVLQNRHKNARRGKPCEGRLSEMKLGQAGEQRRGVGGTRRRQLCHHQVEQILPLRGVRRQARYRGIQVPVDDRLMVAAGEGLFPRQHLMQHHAEAVNVATGIDFLAHGLFGRHVGGGPEHDAVVIPSRWEAFGIVAAEARAAARPVIATDIDGLSEQIAPGAGLLVPSEDPARLVEAICNLAKADIAEMGRVGRRTVLDHFDTHVERWEALLRRCADGTFATADAATTANLTEAA